MRSRAWLPTAVAVIAIACGEPSSDAQRAAPGAAGDQLLYECSAGFPFDPFAFKPGHEEEGNDPVSRGLRSVLASEEGAFLPQTGWTSVGRRANEVSFAAQDDRGNFYDVTLEEGGGRWSFAGVGECRPGPQLVVDANVVEWVLDPDAAAPQMGVRVIHALINELACHSFSDPLDRMNAPRVLHRDDATYVVLTAEPLSGAHACPGTPWVKFDIQLDEPLTTTKLFDAGIYPPRPADREPQ